MRYKCRSEGCKCGGHLSRLVDAEDRCTRTEEGDEYLFPEHLDDPQKTLSLGGARVAEILIGP